MISSATSSSSSRLVILQVENHNAFWPSNFRISASPTFDV